MESIEDKKVTMPTGAKLYVVASSFENSWALFQAVTEEYKKLDIAVSKEFDMTFIKDVFCIFMSSKLIQEKLWACMDKALYNDSRVTVDTFEDEKAREDYLAVCEEVAKKNLAPFTKDLYSKLSAQLGLVETFSQE